jgi:hypothetical protein
VLAAVAGSGARAARHGESEGRAVSPQPKKTSGRQAHLRNCSRREARREQFRWTRASRASLRALRARVHALRARRRVHGVFACFASVPSPVLPVLVEQSKHCGRLAKGPLKTPYSVGKDSHRRPTGASSAMDVMEGAPLNFPTV